MNDLFTYFLIQHSKDQFLCKHEQRDKQSKHVHTHKKKGKTRQRVSIDAIMPTMDDKKIYNK
jgi:hypothetical protein